MTTLAICQRKAIHGVNGVQQVLPKRNERRLI